MNINKIFGFVIVILIFLQISCNRESNFDKNEITFWHFWSEPNQKIILDSLLNKFTAETGIKVKTSELSWNDGKTKLFTAFNSGVTPDVFELGSDWIAQFSSTEVLLKLDFDRNRFIDWSLDPGFWNNNLYAMPWTLDSRIIFYNKDLINKNGFDSAAKSFDEMLLQCQKINKNGNFGFGVNGPDPNRLYKKAIIFLWSFGGDIFKNGKIVINSKENLEALTFYKNLCSVGLIENQKNLDMKFINGKLAYNISGSWLINKIKKENPTLNFGIMNIPNSKNHKGISFAGGEFLSISANSKKIEQSKKLIEFLTKGENSLYFCQNINEAGFPADKNFYQSPDLIKDDLKAIISNQLKNSKMTPTHQNWLKIQEKLEKCFEEVIYLKKSPKKALSDLEQEIIKISNDY